MSLSAQGLTSLDWSPSGGPMRETANVAKTIISELYVFSHPGKHLWKVGGTVNRIRLRADVPDGFDSVYLFGSLGDFLAASPISFDRRSGIRTWIFR